MTTTNTNVPNGLQFHTVTERTAYLKWSTPIKRGFSFEIHYSNAESDVASYTLLKTVPEETFFSNVYISPEIKPNGGSVFFRVKSVRVGDEEKSDLSSPLRIDFPSTLDHASKMAQTILRNTAGEDAVDLVAGEWVTAFAGVSSDFIAFPKAIVSMNIAAVEGDALTELKMRAYVSRSAELADDFSNAQLVMPEEEITELNPLGEKIALLHHISVAEGNYFYLCFTATTATNATVEVKELSYVDYVGGMVMPS